MDKRNRQKQVPIEPIYCAAPQEAHDVLCPGSDDDLDEPARLAKRLRYEEQGLRYLEGRPPRLVSASLRGPFDKDWQNPWLPKRRDTKNSVSRPIVPRPAVKTTASKALARLPGSKNGTPMTGDSMQCHLPSPESNREVQLDGHANLDFEKRSLIHGWANRVPSDTLDRDEFWAPDQGRGAGPHGNSKKRPAASNWLKSKLSKRRTSDYDATSSTIHTPTPAVAIVQASTSLDPDLPITSLEMTTPSSSTGMCSAQSVGKTFDPVTEGEDTDISSDGASSSGDGSQACVSQQGATGVVVDTNAPQTSSPVSFEDRSPNVPERSDAGEADIAFESHMDDSFHYRIRLIRRTVARSASPVLVTTETGAQPEQMEPFGLENNQRSRSCDIQESTSIRGYTVQDYRLAAILERADDTAKESQVYSDDTPSYQRALSLPSQLYPEKCTTTAELDATKRAKTSRPEHRREKQHNPVTFHDNDAALVPVGDITIPRNRSPFVDRTDLPAPALVEEAAATPKISHAGEAEGAQDVQIEAPSNKEASANTTEIPEIECKAFQSTHSTSFGKLMVEDDMTLIGDATHSGNKPYQDAYSISPYEPRVSDSLSGHPEVDTMAEVAYSATQNGTLVRGAVSELTVPPLEPETVSIQDVAQEALENGLDVEDPATQRAVSSMEPVVPEQAVGSPARLSGHTEERPKTPGLDEHAGEKERLEESSKPPDLEEHTGEEDRVEEGSRTPDVDGHTDEEEIEAVGEDLVSPFIDVQHIAEPDARDQQSEPVEDRVPSSRHMAPTSTPSRSLGQDTIGVSQQTPWASTGPEATLELELSVKSFAKFNTPSPKPRHRSYRYPMLSGGQLPSTPLFLDAINMNPWGMGKSQPSQRGTRRVSFAPLPGEEEATNEQPPVRSITRPKSPPPSLDTQGDSEDLDGQFSSHFNAVRERHNQEPKSCLQRLLPTESQQQPSPAISAMETAFRERDAYHPHILEDCPTPASRLQETVENEDEDECTEAPQSPWRNDTQTHALDVDVAAVLQNLDDFLNPRWDTEAPGKLARHPGGIYCLEDQENQGIQGGSDGHSPWEMA